MSGVNATIQFGVSGSFIGEADGGNLRFDLDTIGKTIKIHPGSTLKTQGDILYRTRRTLAGSASENLDLSGTLQDVFKNVIAAQEITAIIILAADDNVGNILVGGAASNRFQGPFLSTGAYVTAPGQAFFAVNPLGWPVTAGTADLLKIANDAAGSATYDILLIGRSAAVV